MKQATMRWALVLAVFAQGCAMEAGEPEPTFEETPGGNEPAAPKSVLSASCERMDELGLAAQGMQLQTQHVEALEAPCISLEGTRVRTLGARECQLVPPTGFSLNGCFDSYDCGGCPVVVRSDVDYGFVLIGQSGSAECADVAAKYALVAAPVCNSMKTHDQY